MIESKKFCDGEGIFKKASFVRNLNKCTHINVKGLLCVFGCTEKDWG